MKALGIIIGLIGEGWNAIIKLAVVIFVIFLVVGFIRSCSANATLNEHSSCQQFAQADTDTQNKVLQDMMNAHGNHDSIQTVRFSVTMYCNVYGDSAPIDGIYSSGMLNQGSAQAVRVTASLTASASASEARSKAAV
ncbi:MAG: hypothetical protein OJF49_003964 [Ktedonobacterales bacterium]|jgi:hypothetical protein|nr:MAG: hypothetical protein OJF49_003964 [Ktedonobacterales bacterium]